MRRKADLKGNIFEVMVEIAALVFFACRTPSCHLITSSIGLKFRELGSQEFIIFFSTCLRYRPIPIPIAIK